MSMPVLSDAPAHKILEFVHSYLRDCSKIGTAKRLGMNIKTVNNWLKTDKVNEVVVREARTIQQKCDLTIDEVLNEIKKIAFFDHKNIVKKISAKVEDGDFGVELQDFDDMDTSAIKNITISMTKDGPIIQVEPYNKLEALKELKDYFLKLNVPDQLHVHLTTSDMEKRTAIQTAHDYQQLVQS